ncbi:MAG: FIST N-terminal domain-containing protein, partial [Bacteroidota bacterium]
MRTYQLIWDASNGWKAYEEESTIQPQWVLFFGQKELLEDGKAIQELMAKFPDSQIFGCSTAGEIIGEEVFDDSIVATAVAFDQTTTQATSIQIKEYATSYAAGLDLGKQFNPEDLKAIFVISDGHHVNGSELVLGMRESLPAEVVITGGLAGDGGKFEETLVAHNGLPEAGRIAAIGFYGEKIRIGHGSVGGWDTFGPERMITKSKDNVLYELDGKPALELYKTYLGEDAERLPASALEFPLSIRATDQQGIGTDRTILTINQEDGSM